MGLQIYPSLNILKILRHKLPMNAQVNRHTPTKAYSPQLSPPSNHDVAVSEIK